MKEKRSGRAAWREYEERAEELAAPIAAGAGAFIYDVEYGREGDEYNLSVYIDKEGGVTIQDCEDVSRLLSDALDRADFLRDPYTLIVSSPGLGRALTRDRHLANSIGKDIEIHLYKPDPETGARDLRGQLVSFDEARLVILAEPVQPAPADKKGKKGAKKAGRKKEAAGGGPAGGDAGGAPADTGDGRRERIVERAMAASIRLAFDF